MPQPLSPQMPGYTVQRKRVSKTARRYNLMVQHHLFTAGSREACRVQIHREAFSLFAHWR